MKNISKRFLLISTFLIGLTCNSQIIRGSPDSEVPDEIAEMPDSEYHTWEKKTRKENRQNEWILFFVLVIGGIAYSIYKSATNDKNK